MAKKKVLVVSDFHCGHRVGLTPPGWNPRHEEIREETKLRDMLWEWTWENIRPLGKLDVVVANGDLIDGRGPKSGSTELIEVDRNEQAKMAADFLARINTKNVYVTYGTPYHSGSTEDWEYTVTNLLGCDDPYAQLDLEVNGLMFNFKHKVGGSSIPHGRATALLREKLWNTLWAERGEFPKAQVVVRSHVHYHVYAGNYDGLAMTTPALQGYGSKFGTRQTSGTVDYGFVYFEVSDKGELSWKPYILRMSYREPQKA